MAKLDGLIRLKKHELDERQKALGELNALLSKLESDVEALEKEKEREIEIAKQDLTLSLSMPLYLQNYENRKQKTLKAIENVEKKIEKATDEMRDAFAELKKYEIVERKRLEKIKQEMKKKEEQMFDDIAIDSYARHQKEKE